MEIAHEAVITIDGASLDKKQSEFLRILLNDYFHMVQRDINVFFHPSLRQAEEVRKLINNSIRRQYKDGYKCMSEGME